MRQAHLQAHADCLHISLGAARNALVSDDKFCIAIWGTTEGSQINNEHDRIRVNLDRNLFESPCLSPSRITMITTAHVTTARLQGVLTPPLEVFTTTVLPPSSTILAPSWSQGQSNIHTRSPADFHYSQPTRPRALPAQHNEPTVPQPTTL